LACSSAAFLSAASFSAFALLASASAFSAAAASGVAFWAGDGPVRPPVLLTPAAAQELYDGLAPIVRRWAAPVGATGD
jgi:hypothetical protein